MHGLGLLLVLIHGGRRGSWRIVDEDGLRDGRRREVGREGEEMYGRERNKTMGRRRKRNPSRGLSITSRRPDEDDGGREREGERKTTPARLRLGLRETEATAALSCSLPLLRPLRSHAAHLQAPAVLLSRAHQHSSSPHTNNVLYCPRPYATPSLSLPFSSRSPSRATLSPSPPPAGTKALRTSVSAPCTQPSGRRTSAREAPNNYRCGHCRSDCDPASADPQQRCSLAPPTFILSIPATHAQPRSISPPVFLPNPSSTNPSCLGRSRQLVNISELYTASYRYHPAIGGAKDVSIRGSPDS